MTKKLLIVVDTQFDFMMPSGALYVGGAEQIIVPGIDFLASLNKDDYQGVLFTADTHYVETWDSMPESKEFPIHCVMGTPGWQNVFNPMMVGSGIPVSHMEKGVFSMWEEDDLDIRLIRPSEEAILQGNAAQDMVMSRNFFFDALELSGIETVQVMGVASDYCVKWAVDGLVKRGFKVEVLTELCRGIGSPANDVFEGVPGYEAVTLL